MGKVEQEFHPELLNSVDIISQENFKLMRNVLQYSVAGPRATGKKAKIDNYNIAGKSGSVQVVSLKKIKMFVLLSV